MKLKFYLVIFVFYILRFYPIYSQYQYIKTNQKSFFSISQESMTIDLINISKDFYQSLNNNSQIQMNNGWYPVKGELYKEEENKIAGYIYFKIGENEFLDREIRVYNYPGMYDSTVCVLNRTYYTRGKNLIDTTYNYWKQPDGSYKLDMRRTYSYHYFDHFESDSFYYEYIFHKWDDVNKQWINYYREKFGYQDTLVQFYNRNSKYEYGTGNTWKLLFYAHDSVAYNKQGFVDTLYKIRNEGYGNIVNVKIGFSNNEQGCYTKMNYFEKKGNKWVEGDVMSNIIWTEWNGFMYGLERASFGESTTPYKRTKVSSYDIDKKAPMTVSFYQKWWDTGTLTNRDTSYYSREGKMFPADAFENIYNEYGDYVSWKNTGFSYPDENGNYMKFYSEFYNKYNYNDLYGMIARKVYQIQLVNNKLDTIFWDGVRYTEFAPLSITEQPQSSKQSLNIYPNPVSDIVTISSAAEMQQLHIFDITGRLVNNQSPSSNQVVFDTGFLPNGVYLVRAQLKDGGQQTGKVVVK